MKGNGLLARAGDFWDASLATVDVAIKGLCFGTEYGEGDRVREWR
jgi:hypothetical protein